MQDGAQVEVAPEAPPPRPYTVLAYKTMATMAERLVAAEPQRFRYFETSWGRFEDSGMDDIVVGGFAPTNLVRHTHVLMMCDFHSNDAILSQLHVLIMLCESFIASLTIFLPYLPKYVLGDGKCGIDALAFPDEGAQKRFGHQLADEGLDFIVCGKQRVGNDRKVTITDGEARGKRVLIIDDMVKTGGTLAEAAKALKASGRDARVRIGHRDPNRADNGSRSGFASRRARAASCSAAIRARTSSACDRGAGP
ncbi:ribose phosphate diphosphokinase [Aureococcus anophagefferens]|nr:ribose phosphate diphosphokinase [Aureococcus anophagefferens]